MVSNQQSIVTRHWLRSFGGFTYVELLIATLVVSLLLLIGIPQYQQYLFRSKIVDAVTTTNPVRVTMEEMYITNGTWPKDNSAASVPELSGSPYIKKVTISDTPVPGSIIIALDYDALANLDATSNTIIYTPKVVQGSIGWECKEGTLDPQYRPAGCRPD
jgi:Tfp pilus assembly protein PilE